MKFSYFSIDDHARIAESATDLRSVALLAVVKRVESGARLIHRDRGKPTGKTRGGAVLAVDERQMAVFERHARARFEARALAYLSELPLHWGDADASLLDAFMERMVALAFAAGLRRERDVVALMALVLRLGPDRWLSPELDWMRQMLRATQEGQPALSALVARLRIRGLLEALDAAAMQAADAAITFPGAYAADDPEALLSSDHRAGLEWGAAYLAAEARSREGFGCNAVGDPVQPVPPSESAGHV